MPIAAPAARSRTQRIRWIAACAVGAAATLGVALAVEPRLFALHQSLGPAQMISFRGPLALVLGALVLLSGGLCLVAKKFRVPLLVVLAVLLAGSVWNLSVILDRGSGRAAEQVESGEGFDVLAWNTQGGGASAAEIAGVILEHGVDAAMLPETTEETASEVAERLEDAGFSYSWEVTGGGSGGGNMPTSLIVSAEMGEYRLDPEAGSTPRLPSGVWRPADPAQPVFVAVHAAPPLPELMDQWRTGLEWAAQQCGPNVVMAGDFNSTMDHWSGEDGAENGGHLAGCVDSAASTGSAAVGTWPTGMPKLLGAPIDHVLTGSHWETTSFEVLADEEAARSDHRPVLAEITRAP